MSTSHPVIRVEGLSKQYVIGAREAAHETFRDMVSSRLAAPFRRFRRLSGEVAPEERIWALRDVSFEVAQGEVLGIIGRNGAGKSTLLKILSRITEPTEGRIEMRGRVASLLEVGTGFHVELTGRENIYLNGAILGMRRNEIDRKFDEIVAFAEIERFLDTPVKRYSSGMAVRLAFAVAAHLEPETMVIDEVLAVGDAAFQRKCLGKMREVSGQGRTVLFVSHNLQAIQNLCSRVLIIENGRIRASGDTAQCVSDYLTNLIPSFSGPVSLVNLDNRSGNGKVQLTSFHLEDINGKQLKSIKSGDDVVFVFGYNCNNSATVSDVDFGFSIDPIFGGRLAVLYSSYQSHLFHNLGADGHIRCLIEKLPLAAGRYRIGGRFTVRREEADWPQDGIAFLDIEAGDIFGTGHIGFGPSAPLLLKGRWSIDDELRDS